MSKTKKEVQDKEVEAEVGEVEAENEASIVVWGGPVIGIRTRSQIYGVGQGNVVDIKARVIAGNELPPGAPTTTVTVNLPDDFEIDVFDEVELVLTVVKRHEG